MKPTYRNLHALVSGLIVVTGMVSVGIAQAVLLWPTTTPLLVVCCAVLAISAVLLIDGTEATLMQHGSVLLLFITGLIILMTWESWGAVASLFAAGAAGFALFKGMERFWSTMHFIPSKTIAFVKSMGVLRKIEGARRIVPPKTRFGFHLATMPLYTIREKMTFEKVNTSETQSFSRIVLQVECSLNKEKCLGLLSIPNRDQEFEKVAGEMKTPVMHAKRKPDFWCKVVHHLIEWEADNVLRAEIRRDERWSDALEILMRERDADYVLDNLRGQLADMLTQHMNEALETYGIEIMRVHILEIEGNDYQTMREERERRIRARNETEELEARLRAIETSLTTGVQRLITQFLQSGVAMTPEQVNQIMLDAIERQSMALQRLGIVDGMGTVTQVRNTNGYARTSHTNGNGLKEKMVGYN